MNILSKSFRDHGKICFDLFERSLINFAYAYEVGNDINSTVCSFHNKLYEMYDSCCPIRKKNVQRNRYIKKWINVNHVKCIDTKCRLFHRYKAGLVSIDLYKNIVFSLLRKEKESFSTNTFDDAISDTRKTWNLLHDLVSN